MVMSLTSLLTLQLATLAEYDQLHGEILSKEELAETTKQRILQLVTAIQEGRFKLEALCRASRGTGANNGRARW